MNYETTSNGNHPHDYGEDYDSWKYIKQQIHKRRCQYILNKYQSIREVGLVLDKDITSIIGGYL